MSKVIKRVKDYSFEWLTEKGILETFLDSYNTLRFALTEREDQRKKVFERVKSELHKLYTKYPNDTWFGDILVEKLYLKEVLEEDKHIARLKRLISLAEPKNFSSSVESFEERRLRAKSQPIEAVARSKLELKQSGKNWKSLCPLHQEKTASFYLYTESNTWYCFGCSQGGDNISLTQHLFGLSFREAVEMLNK